MADERAIHILLVEDDPDDQFTLKRALKKAAITVSMDLAEDGRQAVEYLSTRARPDLVFLDLKLPFVTGFEVLEFIRGRAELADLPVVILSGSDEQRDHERAIELGVTAYLVKPPLPEGLKEILASVRLA